MDYTPFSDKSLKKNNFLSQHNIEFTDKVNECDLLLTNRYPGMKRRLYSKIRYRNRPILLWTHEPRFDQHFSTQLNSYYILPEFHVMNVYTGDVHLCNYTMYSKMIRGHLPLIDHSIDSVCFSKNRSIAFLGSYITESKRNPLIKDGRDLNLCGYRQDLALIGHQRGLVDIYGKGWPSGFSIEDSRGGKWHGRKLDILQKYKFNLCLENTNYNYYCTEKIWDSIAAQCLPIYYGKHNRIYETFPRESFIDVADFDSPESVFDYIENMAVDEYRDRMNCCIDVYNRLSSNSDEFDKQRKKMLDNAVHRIHAILS